jgi:hypothetical protein
MAYVSTLEMWCRAPWQEKIIAIIALCCGFFFTQATSEYLPICMPFSGDWCFTWGLNWLIVTSAVGVGLGWAIGSALFLGLSIVFMFVCKNGTLGSD